MTSPGSSVPDLRKRQPMFYVIIGAALLLLVGGAIAAIIAVKTPKDLGLDACAQVERQAELSPPAVWDDFIDRFASEVNANVTTAQNEPITITADKRGAKCHEALRKLKKAMKPEDYDALATCLAEATNPRQGTRCFGFLK
jgi:hypothetical protein